MIALVFWSAVMGSAPLIIIARRVRGAAIGVLAALEFVNWPWRMRNLEMLMLRTENTLWSSRRKVLLL